MSAEPLFGWIQRSQLIHLLRCDSSLTQGTSLKMPIKNLLPWTQAMQAGYWIGGKVFESSSDV